MDKNSYMEQAIALAQAAAARGEIPVGAIVVDGKSGEIVAQAGNRTEELNDPTAHAEVLAIREAAALQGSPRLENCDLYVTLEPCPLCATALSFARVRRLYFGAYDPKGGGVDHGPRIYEHPTCHHKPEVYGGLEEIRCAGLLKDFFKPRR
ncbi:MAG: nucleoside deaminase [Rhodospirillales bacterium]|nr:nucleoside deaminase [Rhodospirillales bacterium]